MNTEENIPYWLKNTNSAVNNMKESKKNKIEDQNIKDYNVTVILEGVTHEYFIRAWGFQDILVRLSRIVEPKVSIFKCEIKIQEA